MAQEWRPSPGAIAWNATLEGVEPGHQSARQSRRPTGLGVGCEGEHFRDLIPFGFTGARSHAVADWAQDKLIQGQLRHSKAKSPETIACGKRGPEPRKAVVDLERKAKSVVRSGKALKQKERGSNSVVESQPSKLLVAGSIPVSRSMFSTTYGQ